MGRGGDRAVFCYARKQGREGGPHYVQDSSHFAFNVATSLTAHSKKAESPNPPTEISKERLALIQGSPSTIERPEE